MTQEIIPHSTHDEFVEVPANKASMGQRKPIYGRGVNDAPYRIMQVINGKRIPCSFYAVWRGMLGRCYSEKSHKRYPTYRGCSVCDSWLTFSNFRRWMETQPWQGKELDKDCLVPGNKIYSPSTCVFISRSLNAILCDSAAKRGKYPRGVCWHETNKGFAAQISINGKAKNIGRYPTIGEAAAAYDKERSQYLVNTANQQEDYRIAAALIRHASLQRYKTCEAWATYGVADFS